MKILRTIPISILATGLVLGGGCDGSKSDKHFHGDALRLDGRYHQEILFTHLRVQVPLPRNAYVRVDSLVAETADHVRLLLEELGVSATNINYTNPAKHGGQLHLCFRDGRECSFIWVRRDPDPRIAEMRLEHEKYHALCRLGAGAIPSLSARIAELGFRVNLANYDEELAATLIEILTLHLNGVPLRDIQGSALVEKGIQLLQDARMQPDFITPSVTPDDGDWRIDVRWPADRDLIELPLECLDDLPAVRCTLNGKGAILYIATASQPTCLYQDRMARFGIEAAGEVDCPRYTALGRAEKTGLTGGFRLEFKEGLRMEVSRAPCLPGDGRNPNHDVDGILGAKVLKALNGVIDIGAEKLILKVEKKSRPAKRTGQSPSCLGTTPTDPRAFLDAALPSEYEN